MTLIALGLLRVLVFFWIGATSFSIFQLYNDGYRIAGKNSPIITSLMRILLWISVIFFYLSITALAHTFELECHRAIVTAMPIFMLPLGFLLTKFRKESIRKQ